MRNLIVGLVLGAILGTMTSAAATPPESNAQLFHRLNVLCKVVQMQEHANLVKVAAACPQFRPYLPANG